MIAGLYIDTETGGLDPKIHALTSICVGAFTLFPDREPEINTFYRAIRPTTELAVPDVALRVQGVSQAEIYGNSRATEKETLASLSLWLSANELLGLPVWAHNADFDRSFLSAACDRKYSSWGSPSGDTPFVCALAGRDARWNCTRYLAEKLVAQGKLELPRKADGTGSVSLDPLMRRLGIVGRAGAGHDAQEDVRLGVAVLDELIRIDGWWAGNAWMDGR